MHAFINTHIHKYTERERRGEKGCEGGGWEERERGRERERKESREKRDSKSKVDCVSKSRV